MIPDRTWIDERPESINNRSEKGHWEGDTLGNRKGETETVVGIIERKSRRISAEIIPNKKSEHLVPLHQKWTESYAIKSLTLDNGIEYKKHSLFGTKTYFCHPYSSWEKGQIEYGMRLLRRLIPKKSFLKDCSPQKLKEFIDDLNNTPRKCLNWKTPNEVFFDNSS